MILKMRSVRSMVLLLTGIGVVACHTPTITPPVSVSAVRPNSGERIAIDQAMVLIDTSSSISDTSNGAARVARSFIAGMPDGNYEAGAVNFGGYARENLDLGRYSRSNFQGYAGAISDLNEGTPIHKALAEAGEALKGKTGRAAVVLVSDGVPTDEVGRDVPGSLSLEAASALKAAHGGSVCLHTVQVGADPAGTAFLQSLSGAVGCGTHRSAASLGTEGAYHAFEREVFLAAAQKPPTPTRQVAVKPGDADGDGVLDNVDSCPGTLAGAVVDSRGCWVLPGMNFATNSAEIPAEGRSRLDGEVVPVLQRNPGVRIRIEGHTDDRGAAAYNQNLSERRAESVRSYLVSRGISAGQLLATGYGEERPAAPNDTAANLRRNRRIELSIAK